MSRSRKDILETEAMLTRLTNLLVEHAAPENRIVGPRADAESLRRISMTLRRWHELECGDSDAYSSWCITRGRMRKFVPEKGKPIRQFEHDENGSPFMERHYYTATIQGPGNPATYSPLPDRELGAKTRLAKILKRYPALQAYVQTDPRGCALYILKPGDVPEGTDISSCYSRGLAVHQ